MTQQQILKSVYIWVKDFYQQAAQAGIVKGGHGFDHTLRVAGMALRISQEEKLDPFLPTLAALIHDIGRSSNDQRSFNWQHGELSWELSEKFIMSLSLPDNDIQLLKNAVEDHPKLNDKVRQSFVVEILMDADRLDQFGAIGPLRAAAHRTKLPLYKKQSNTKSTEDDLESVYQDFTYRAPKSYQMMWTRSGKKLAKKRVIFLKKFSKEFKEEVEFALKPLEELDFN